MLEKHQRCYRNIYRERQRRTYRVFGIAVQVQIAGVQEAGGTEGMRGHIFAKMGVHG